MFFILSSTLVLLVVISTTLYDDHINYACRNLTLFHLWSSTRVWHDGFHRGVDKYDSKHTTMMVEGKPLSTVSTHQVVPIPVLFHWQNTLLSLIRSLIQLTYFPRSASHLPECVLAPYDDDLTPRQSAPLSRNMRNVCSKVGPSGMP